MLLGCIADDFTGASDLANTLAKGGMEVVQFVGTPDRPPPAGCEAGVIALKTRSIPARKAIEESLRAFHWLREQGCRQLFFKYCSTFDSTPAGNIGPVAEALLDAVEARAAIVCPAFPATGRSVFMGHLFVNDRLLNESGMERHPLNPMTDPDIRRWLARQSASAPGFVAYSEVRQGPQAIRAAIEREALSDRRLIVVDAVGNDDLMAIGVAVADDPLVTGGSGIASGLPDNFRRRGLLAGSGAHFTPAKGLGVVLSGSCSDVSRDQVKAYLFEHPGLAIDPATLFRSKTAVDDAFTFVLRHFEQSPIVYSTAEPDAVRTAQERLGGPEVAAAVERFFGELALRLVDAGATRLVVGGGETSGAVVAALGIERLKIGPEIAPGVPALAAEGRHDLRLALKSGNFGLVGFFHEALQVLEGS